MILNQFGVASQTEIIVLERFGKITRTVSSGIYFRRPFETARIFIWSWNGESVSERRSLPLNEQSLDPPALAVRAKMYPCNVDILVRYRLVDPIKASKISADPLRSVMVNAKSHLKDVISNYTWTELQQQRQKISDELQTHINNTTEEKYGITITEVVIENIYVSQDVENRFRAGAKLDTEIENTKKRRHLAIFEEQTKTTLLKEDLERQRLQFLSNADKLSEDLDRLNKSGVDVSNYLLAKSMDTFSEALSHSNVTTLVLNISGDGGIGIGNKVPHQPPVILHPPSH